MSRIENVDMNIGNNASDTELSTFNSQIQPNHRGQYTLVAHASNSSMQQASLPYPYIPPQSNSDYVDPLNNIETAIKVGIKKAKSTSIKNNSKRSIIQIILKSMMSGAYLGFSSTLTLYAISLKWNKISASLLFPTGFVMLILMGNDLATGNFCLLPMAYLSQTKKIISISMILMNWAIVYFGNFLGALTYLFFLWGSWTHFGQRDISKYDDFSKELCTVTDAKTLGYVETGGAAGWFGAVFNGIMCNWMVTMGVLLSFSSKSTIGKIFAMYIPITLFITLGFEHSIVNLFLLPAGFAFECNTYNVGQWLLWNQIPVTIGNMFGGIVLTGVVYYVIWSDKVRDKYNEDGAEYKNIQIIGG